MAKKRVARVSDDDYRPSMPPVETVEPDLPVSEPGSILLAELPAAVPTAAEEWHLEAGEILALTRAGEPVSPGRLLACLLVAVGLVKG